MLEMAPFANMDDETKALALKTMADIKAGKNKVFVGPLTDQAGAIKVVAGATMDDGAMNSMQWLVKGIEGKLS